MNKENVVVNESATPKKNKKKRSGSLDVKKSRMGWLFITPFLIGFFLLYLPMIVESIRFSFSEIDVQPGGGFVLINVGWKNYSYSLFTDPDFVTTLAGSLKELAFNVPAIVIFSLFMAVLLNQKMRGRAIFRAIFFIPIIIANSVVMDMLNSDIVTMPLFSSGTGSNSLINYQEIISGLGIPEQISPILTFLLSNTINLIWKCGVQTILFLAGLQSISASMYEVSKIEGANKWEEFWYVTFPMLSGTTMLIIVFTSIESFIDPSNEIMRYAFDSIRNSMWVEAPTMLWIYFAVVGSMLGLVVYLLQKFIFSKWAS